MNFLLETYSRDEALESYNAAPITEKRVNYLAKYGFRFVPGNNPNLGYTAKWREYYPIRVAQTNSRVHGYSIQTLWAVRQDGMGGLMAGWDNDMP